MTPRVSMKSHKKVDDDDVLIFFRQLTTLFRAGTPIYEALVISSDQSQSDNLAEAIENVARKVASGAAMHEAMATYPESFKTEWVEVIKSGEASGKLGEILSQLVAQIDATNKMRRRLASAMVYPAVIFSVAVSAIIVMLVKVVPTFAEMFESFDKELPDITKAVLAISDFLQARGLLIVGVIAAVVFTVRRYIKTPDGRRQFHIFVVSVPVIGDVVIHAAMQKFAINVSLLLRAGLPLLETIHSVRGIFQSNWVFENALQKVAKHVERGGTMADALEQTGVFTSFIVSMTRIGEESGSLPQVLDETEEFYRTKVETLIGRVTGLMETAVILFMGVAVAGILTSVYIPMFSMAGGIS